MSRENGWLSILKSFPAFIIIMLTVSIVIPVPILALDILIGLNILFALIILLIVLYTKSLMEISILPTLILIFIIFTLTVNISAIRPIFTKGAEFDGWLILFVSGLFAGKGDSISLYIGFFLLCAIVSIFFMVICKSIVRLSYVAARFHHDSMKIQMMAIEAEYSCGAITEEEVQCKKQAIRMESDFLSALDGASKFILGNAKLFIFFIIVIIIAGTAIDYFVREIEIIDAVKTHIFLAIGSGFLFMLPVTIVSLAMGIVITRYASPDNETNK